MLLPHLNKIGCRDQRTSSWRFLCCIWVGFEWTSLRGYSESLHWKGAALDEFGLQYQGQIHSSVCVFWSSTAGLNCLFLNFCSLTFHCLLTNHSDLVAVSYQILLLFCFKPFNSFLLLSGIQVQILNIYKVLITWLAPTYPLA